MKPGRKEKKLNPDWLIRIAVEIENGNTSIFEASKEARVMIKNKSGFYTTITHPVSPGTVRSGLEKLGIKVDLKPGRRRKQNLGQIEDTIISLHEETMMGATKVYEQLVANSQDNPLFCKISHRMVYNTIKSNGLLKFTKPPEKDPPKIRCRYEANNPDLIWHTDLHCFDGQYLIAFVDDFSRFIVHFELIPTKDSEITKAVLEIALKNNNRPFSIWTDNGTEFKGNFKRFCDENDIKIVLTEVANPQQNGKCERFWQTADHCKNFDELKQWVQRYNNMPHFGLPQTTVNGRKTHLTPFQRYSQNVHWNPSIPPTWIVDGISKDFKPKEK